MAQFGLPNRGISSGNGTLGGDGAVVHRRPCCRRRWGGAFGCSHFHRRICGACMRRRDWFASPRTHALFSLYPHCSSAFRSRHTLSPVAVVAARPVQASVADASRAASVCPTKTSLLAAISPLAATALSCIVVPVANGSEAGLSSAVTSIATDAVTVDVAPAGRVCEQKVLVSTHVFSQGLQLICHSDSNAKQTATQADSSNSRQRQHQTAKTADTGTANSGDSRQRRQPTNSKDSGDGRQRQQQTAATAKTAATADSGTAGSKDSGDGGQRQQQTAATADSKDSRQSKTADSKDSRKQRQRQLQTKTAATADSKDSGDGRQRTAKTAATADSGDSQKQSQQTANPTDP